MKIKPLKKLFFLLIILYGGFLQAQTIKGKVTSADGPLPGASVIVKGTDNGTSTDFNGDYIVNNVPKDGILVVSYIGYLSQEILVTDQSTINVTLVEDASTLSEVVITGYTKQDTRNITGAVSVIKADVLAETTPTSLEQALQGQAAGVTVGSEGGPGGSAAVRIRGFGTVNGNDPLYVIDGVQTGQGLNDINPDDIASIQILKDAASSSIYGIGAANGVIIITTKSGKKNGQTKFTFSSMAGVDFIPSSVFPEMASPQQLADAYWTASTNDGVTPTHPQYGSGANPILPDYILPQGVTGTVDESAYNYPNNRITRANQAGTDWFDEFFQSSFVQQHNVGISGGSDTSKFYAGFGFLNQEGVGVFTSFDRFSLRLNSEFDITKRFRIGESVNIGYTERIGISDPINDNDNQNNESQIASLYRMHPIIPVRDIAGNYAGTSGIAGVGNGYNPIAVADRNKENVNKGLRVLAALYAELDLTEDLMFKTTFTANINNSDFAFFQPIDYENATARAVNQLRETTTNGIATNWMNILKYSKTIKDDHNIDVFVGTEFKKNTYKQTYANITGFLFTSPSSTYLSAGTGTQTVGGSQNKSATFSVFGKVDYSYKDKYLLSATHRMDKSSRFNPENNQASFSAFSLGWRLSDEDFFGSSDTVNNLMLKFSWGQVGNDAIPTGRGVTAYGPDNAFYNYAGNTGYFLTNIGDPSLTWETTTTTNFGIVGKFFNNKVNLGLDIYNSVTEDMLLPVPVDPTFSGNTISSIYKNFGEMTNKGFDLSLGYSSNSDKDFNYNIGVNISRYKNNVEYLDPNNLDLVIENPTKGAQTGFATTGTVAGSPISSFIGYTWDENTRSVDFSGDVHDIIGDPHPDFTYGINLGADYKNFDLSMFFQGSQGNDIYNLTKFWTDFSGFEGGKSLDYVNETRHDLTLDVANSTGSSYYIEDGSYLRLKNLSIGYTFDDNTTSKLGIEKVRIFVQAKNLLTITNYSGLDPEINLTNYSNQEEANLEIGVDRGAYPISRSFNIGLNVTF